MKIVKVEYLIDSGHFSETEQWKTIESNIEEAIKAIHWPPQSNSFTLYDKKNSNGVRPIKTGCMLKLQEFGWDLEERIDIATNRRVGAIDAVYPLGDQYFALEWETGNISSSHRAINKMCLGILKGVLVGGVLILPTRKMYYYLTDRIGNFK